MEEEAGEFSHIDKKNNPGMVDISVKKKTMRSASAHGEVRLPRKIKKMFQNGDIQTKKGAVFQTAIIAGTMAVKQTDRLIPFCHSLPIESVDFSIILTASVLSLSVT